MSRLFPVILCLLVGFFSASKVSAWEGKYTGVGRGSDGKLRVLTMKVKLRSYIYVATGTIYIRQKNRKTGMFKFGAEIHVNSYSWRDDELIGFTMQSPIGAVHARAKSRYRFGLTLVETLSDGTRIQTVFIVKCADKECKKPLPPCSGAFIGNYGISTAPAKVCLQTREYSIYSGVNCGDTIFIAKPSELTGVKMCSVTGCGMNCATDVQFTRLAGPYASEADGQKALCTFLTAKWYNSMVPWGPYVSWGGKTYRCFMYDCQGALSKYCPQL